MTLKINSLAPDFKAQTQLGDLSFHEWLGDSWGCLLYTSPRPRDLSTSRIPSYA